MSATLTALLESPIIIITALLIGTICEALRRFFPAHAGDPGIRGVFYLLSTGRTPDSQGILPVLLAAPLGFIPWLPIAEGLEKDGYELAGRLGTYIFAGIVCKLGYDLVVGFLMTSVRHFTARAANVSSGASKPPSAGGTSERP